MNESEMAGNPFDPSLYAYNYVEDGNYLEPINLFS